MWTRSELKAKAKTAFKGNYWMCVLASLILTVVLCMGTGAGSAVGQNAGNAGSTEKVTMQDVTNMLNSAAAGANVSVQTFITVLVTIMIISVIISTIVNIFLQNPVCVGGCKFFVENAKEPAGMGNLSYGFTGGNYGKVVVTMLLKNIFIYLWSLLFVIPGIIKGYEYRMVSYILADQPELSRKEAFQLSKQMMKGQKWNAFVLDLSFIGWYLLCLVTCGIAGIFYVYPYVFATDAELYLALKKDM